MVEDRLKYLRAIAHDIYLQEFPGSEGQGLTGMRVRSRSVVFLRHRGSDGSLWSVLQQPKSPAGEPGVL